MEITVKMDECLDGWEVILGIYKHLSSIVHEFFFFLFLK